MRRSGLFVGCVPTDYPGLGVDRQLLDFDPAVNVDQPNRRMGCTGFSALDKLCESVMQMKVWLKQVDVTSNCCSSVETKQVIVRKRTHAYQTSTSQPDIGSDDMDRASADSPPSPPAAVVEKKNKKVVLEDTITKEEYKKHRKGLVAHEMVNVDVQTLVRPPPPTTSEDKEQQTTADSDKADPHAPSLPVPPTK